MAKPKSTRKRNPQDSTRRNVQASAKRDAKLMARMLKAEHRLDITENTLTLLIQHLRLDRSPFESQQRSMGYRHSTSFPASIRVKG